MSQQLPRVMRLRDVVLFNVSAIVGLRWLTTAASQFGLASLGLWLVAMVVFFLPSAIAVRELSDIDPGAGGIYRWVRRAFGPLHGFVAGWGYWVNNLFYFPSLLVTTAAIAAYAAGPRFVHLGDNNVFIAALSLAGLWLAVGMNVVGLRVGKRLQNLGGHGTWVPGLIFVVLAIWSLTTHGSATPVTARGLVPATLDLQSINLFATMTFAFAGLELAPTLGDEIHDHRLRFAERPLTLRANFREHRLAAIAVGTGHGRLRKGQLMAFIQSHAGMGHEGNTKAIRSRERTSAASVRTSSPRAARTIKPAIDCISSSVAPILVISLVPIRPTASTMRLFASRRSANWAEVRPHPSLRAVWST